MDSDKGESLAVGACFAALAIGTAAAFVPLRATLGAANVALVLVLVVVAAASLGGRTGGAITAVAASVAFNFFHTKPYLTVRIDHPRDIATVVLILGVGLAVGELGVARRRQSETRRSHLRSMRRLEGIGALVSGGADIDSVWESVKLAVVETLGPAAVRFDPGVHHALPVVERDGSIDIADRRYVRGGFALPAGGVALNVSCEGSFLGQIVVRPTEVVAVSREQRRAAQAIADQFGIAVHHSGSEREFH